MLGGSFLQERPATPFAGRSLLYGLTVPAGGINCVRLMHEDPPATSHAAENGSGASGPTLDELARRLAELRENFDEVVASLDGLREDARVIREDVRAAISAYGSGSPGRDEGGLRCHECGRIDAAERPGWTLRLCGDDELHPFCPDCDRRRVRPRAASA
jgi:hypothetical protein